MAKRTSRDRSQYINISVHRNLVYLFVGAAALLLMMTFYSHFYYEAPLMLASAEELASSAGDIERQGFKKDATNCMYDSREPADRAFTYDSYIRVNKYANRAVIRGCNDIDSLLMKDFRGVWHKTDVNIGLDYRANPVWQKACLIDDITNADDQVRPENSSIDHGNLEMCRYMRKYNKVKTL